MRIDGQSGGRSFGDVEPDLTSVRTTTARRVFQDGAIRIKQDLHGPEVLSFVCTEVRMHKKMQAACPGDIPDIRAGREGQFHKPAVGVPSLQLRRDGLSHWVDNFNACQAQVIYLGQVATTNQAQHERLTYAAGGSNVGHGV